MIDRMIFPDETIFKGVRPYQLGDPARYIDWRASARLTQTMTKQFFSSINPDVLVILNTQTSEPYWSQPADDSFDRTCEWIVHLAAQLQSLHTNLLFATNAVIAGHKSNSAIVRVRQNEIASLLGHSLPLAAFSLTPILAQLLQKTHASPSHIWLFSSFETPEQASYLQRIQRTGKQLHIIRFANGGEPFESAAIDSVHFVKRKRMHLERHSIR